MTTEITLSDSIEIAERWYAGGYATQIEDVNPAIKLLIEAGKRIIELRSPTNYAPMRPLPSETKE